MTKLKLTCLFWACISITKIQAQRDPQQAYDNWRSMRMGLFIHWGPSAGLGTPESHSHARKSALNPHGSIPAEEYDELYKKFNPTNYNPDAWLSLAYSAGMRYAVFVAKHHDGFCLFDTKATDYNIMATPYKRDVAKMFAEACQRQRMALGWQFSPKDWKHPDFNTDKHDRYNAFYTQLLDDLTANYGNISVMWFDGIEPVGKDKWKYTPAKAAEMMYKRHPNLMLGTHGAVKEDFTSFEIAVGPFDRTKPWETAEGINPSGWIFNKPMPTFPFRDLLRTMIYTVSRDGNYLLDVGPMPDGTLYPPDSLRLLDFVQFMKINAEGIHGTRGGPYRDGAWGGATCKDKSVYLFISDEVGTQLTLPTLPAKILKVSRLDGESLNWKTDKDKLLLQFPDRKQGQKPHFICVKLDLDKAAYDLPIIEGQQNLLENAKAQASSIKDNNEAQYGIKGLFDNKGETAWETAKTDTVCTLEFDLGKIKSLSALSLSEKGQIENWNHGVDIRLKIKKTPTENWQQVLQHKGAIGAPPILTFDKIEAQFVKIEISKRASFELQIAELRLFSPLE
jgi:alpha-L-fucosidase